jgi:hypothetical protein
MRPLQNNSIESRRYAGIPNNQILAFCLILVVSSHPAVVKIGQPRRLGSKDRERSLTFRRDGAQQAGIARRGAWLVKEVDPLCQHKVIDHYYAALVGAKVPTTPRVLQTWNNSISVMDQRLVSRLDRHQLGDLSKPDCFLLTAINAHPKFSGGSNILKEPEIIGILQVEPKVTIATIAKLTCIRI